MKKKALFAYIITLIITFVIIVGDIAWPITQDKIGYTIWSYYIILPLLTLIFGFILGTVRSYKKYFFAPYVGLMYLVASLIVSHTTDIFIPLFGMIPSIVGLCISSLLFKILKK